MNHAITRLTLLAQGDYTDMGRRFRRGGSGVEIGDLLILIACLVGVAVVAVLVTRHFSKRQERGYTSQRALFTELCRSHGLSWTHRRLLKRLAAQHGMSPCELFLEPARFASEHCQGPLAPYAGEIASLKEELF